MEERVLVKISARNDDVSIRTVSRSFRSPCDIFIGAEELWEFQQKGKYTLRSGLCVADMERIKLPSRGEYVRLLLMWLEEKESGDISGHTEQICLPYSQFCGYAEACAKDGKERRLLSVRIKKRPKIEFRSLRNLKETVGNRAIRKKLGKFLDSRLNWPRYERIVLSDDFEPYSFGFAGYTPEGIGLCGAVIYNRRNKPGDAFYSIHT